MSWLRLLGFVALLALVGCQRADTDAGLRHLEHLCDVQGMREDYLDFYWDDLRSNQPELWAQALGTCSEICPDAVNCGPVLSVASWYDGRALDVAP